MRYAIYFTPGKEDPLTKVAERWLGRSAFSGKQLEARSFGAFTAAEVSLFTADPRRYGFHATLKAPFRLAEGKSEAELLEAFQEFAAARTPFLVERIRLARLGGFFALVPAQQSLELDQLAADAVVAFEPFRAPLLQSEIERRNPEKLSPSQLKNLHEWGYPYVFQEFRFHMTLTGRVPEAEAQRMEEAITSLFRPLFDRPLKVDALALVVEPEPGAPFYVKSFRAMGGGRERKIA